MISEIEVQLHLAPVNCWQISFFQLVVQKLLHIHNSALWIEKTRKEMLAYEPNYPGQVKFPTHKLFPWGNLDSK
jgi:hypothetical protein